MYSKQYSYTSPSGIQYSSGGLEHHFKDPFGRRSGIWSLSSDGSAKLIRSGLSASHSHSLSRRQGILSYSISSLLYFCRALIAFCFSTPSKSAPARILKKMESPISTHIYTSGVLRTRWNSDRITKKRFIIRTRRIVVYELE